MTVSHGAWLTLMSDVLPGVRRIWAFLAIWACAASAVSMVVPLAERAVIDDGGVNSRPMCTTGRRLMCTIFR